MKTLPTGRVVFWTFFGSTFLLILSVVIFLSVLGVSAFATVLAVIGALGSLLGVILGVERWLAMRTGRLGERTLERFFDHKMTEKVDDSSTVLIDSVLRGPEFVESMTEMLMGGVERVVSPRKRRNLERMTAAIRADLLPDEKILVVAQASRVPHGAKRVLSFVTFGLGFLIWMKVGVLAVTDRRVLFHRYRRKRATLLTADPLTGVSVREWFKGLGASERMHWVLILRRPDGSLARFQIHRFWRNEGRTAFELLAAVSPDPPAALANYWRAGSARS